MTYRKYLRAVLPDGLTSTQADALRVSIEHLDDLTVTTIHGFCQGLIKAYSVEVGIDPGARVLDESQANSMFDDAFNHWFGSRLGDGAVENSPIAILAREQPREVVKTIKDLGRLRLAHRSARPHEPEPFEDLRHEFIDAVRAFEQWYSRVPQQPQTEDIVQEISELAAHFEAKSSLDLDFASLWALAAVPRKRLMLPKPLCWRQYHVDAQAFEVVAEPKAGIALRDAAECHFEAARSAFTSLIGGIAAHLVRQLSDDLDGLLDEYARRKRASAALDFDDLLLLARDLVKSHDEIAGELGERFRHICVDEFQDTDPVQAEIIFRIAAEAPPTRWQNALLRCGSLFFVGDPKQSIYRFRGADVEAYEAAKATVCGGDSSRLLTITANFRSRYGILDHVNGCFEPVLKKEHGQPEYVWLASVIGSGDGDAPCVVRLTVPLPPRARADERRDAEAECVAKLCSRLIGAVEVRRDDGTLSPLQPGDIALLAPAHNDLWRYERALERAGLSVASQAGKALMIRQETQDLLVLARTLADPLDTVAFGALLRGPLIGFTEGELLDIEAGLRSVSGWTGGTSAFNVRTDPALVSNQLAASVLRDLQSLRQRIFCLTPRALLSEAVERLKIRVAMALRSQNREARAIANLDAVLEMARGCSVRGLGEFVRDLGERWSSRERMMEGRSDSDEHAIELVTFHNSKGLEWPVVIPVNTGTEFRRPKQFLHRRSDDSLHWALGGIQPPGLELARREQKESEERERSRTWYVACTRARDLLVLPWMQAGPRNSWYSVLDLGQERLREFDTSVLPCPSCARRSSGDQNSQSASQFAAEAAIVAQVSRPLDWRRPSDRDPDRVRLAVSGDQPGLSASPLDGIQGSRGRGIILHKLMEDLLTGRVLENVIAVRERAILLSSALGSAGESVDPSEAADTALATLSLPDIAALRPNLVPEMPIYGQEAGGTLIAARADAVALTDGKIEIVLDWKSDVDPSASDRAAHAAQVAEYVHATSARKGAVVYMTGRHIEWVRLRSA